jgi:hypothetical protein
MNKMKKNQQRWESLLSQPKSQTQSTKETFRSVGPINESNWTTMGCCVIAVRNSRSNPRPGRDVSESYLEGSDRILTGGIWQDPIWRNVTECDRILSGGRWQDPIWKRWDRILSGGMTESYLEGCDRVLSGGKWQNPNWRDVTGPYLEGGRILSVWKVTGSYLEGCDRTLSGSNVTEPLSGRDVKHSQVVLVSEVTWHSLWYTRYRLLLIASYIIRPPPNVTCGLPLLPSESIRWFSSQIGMQINDHLAGDERRLFLLCMNDC